MPNLDKMSPRNSQHMCNVCGTDKRRRARGILCRDKRGSETNFETYPTLREMRLCVRNTLLTMLHPPNNGILREELRRGSYVL